MTWEIVIYTRTELYEQVWKRPLCDLAAEHGISDVALAKICRKLGVPRPGRGHWARKAAGKNVERPPLPPLQEGQVERFGVSRWKDPLDEHRLGADAEALLVRESHPSMKIEVSETLNRPHPWVSKSAAVLKRHSKNPSGALYEGPCLEILASKSARGRALRVTDALLKAFEERGFTIEVSEPVSHRRARNETPLPSRTGVRVLGTLVEFGLVERFDSIKVQPKPRKLHPGGALYSPPSQYERRPNGKLALEIRKPIGGRARRTWCDGKRQRVEACLNEFVVALIKAAERERIAVVERARLESERAEARQHREKQERCIGPPDSASRARLLTCYGRISYAHFRIDYFENCDEPVQGRGDPVRLRPSGIFTVGVLVHQLSWGLIRPNSGVAPGSSGGPFTRVRLAILMNARRERIITCDIAFGYRRGEAE